MGPLKPNKGKYKISQRPTQVCRVAPIGLAFSRFSASRFALLTVSRGLQDFSLARALERDLKAFVRSGCSAALKL